MRVGNLNSGSVQLQEALEKLMLSWEATKEAWVDQKAQDFEEIYLRPIGRRGGADRACNWSNIPGNGSCCPRVRRITSLL